MSGRIEDSLRELGSLPEIEPPPELEQATLSAMAAAADVDSVRPAATATYFLKAAAWVVAVGLGAWLAIWATVIDEASDDSSAVSAPSAEQAYFQLAEQAMQLEEMLALMPAPRRVMRADTASTIVGLEDRIALIDAELNWTEAVSAPPQYREALMRDRVEVMNALLNVRYAQSRAFVY